MQIDVEKATNFVKEDPDGIRKFLIGCFTLLLSFLILPALSTMGYAMEAARESSEGEDQKMPEWNRWAEFMARGFWLLLIGAVILSIPIALNIFGTWRNFVTALGTSKADAVLTGSEVSMLGPICLKASLALGLVLSYLLPGAYLRYARTLKPADGFALGGVLHDIKQSPMEYTLIWAIPMVIFFLSNLLISLQLPFNLGYVASVAPNFFAMILGAKLMGQYYRAHLTNNP